MTDETERLPFSARRPFRTPDRRLPQDLTADEHVNAAVAADLDHRRPEVNLGFARLKGPRT